MRLQAIKEIQLKKEYTWSLHLKSFVHPKGAGVLDLFCCNKKLKSKRNQSFRSNIPKSLYVF